MARTVHDAKEALRTMASVDACATRHPWMVAGSAVAVGFVAGVLLPSSSEKTIPTVRSRTEARLQRGCRKQEARTKKSVVLATAAKSLASVLQSLVQALVTTVLFPKGERTTPTLERFGSREALVPEGRSD